jgi:hypothetical protein
MKQYILIIVVVILFVVGCTLKRSNPLDPNAHTLTIPQDITHLVITHSPAHTDNHWAQLSWDKLPTENADGYHIYRGQSYNGTYQRLDGTPGYPLVINPPNPTDSLSNHYMIWIDGAQSASIPNGIVPGDYYYKVSAYKRQGTSDSTILEGHLSPWVYTRVPQ